MQAHPLSRSAARSFDPLPVDAFEQRPPLRFSSPAPAAPPLASPRLVPESMGLAHDAANLLGALGLYCDLLECPGVLAPEHQHYARELRGLSRRSGALMQRLVDVSGAAVAAAAVGALPAGCAVPSPHRTKTRPGRRSATDAIADLSPLLRSLGGTHARVDVQSAEDLPPLPYADDVLERISINLVRNAVAALAGRRSRHRPPGEIVVSLHAARLEPAPGQEAGPAASVLRLTVSDNGPGMQPAAAACFLKPRPLPPGTPRGMLPRGVGHRVVQELLRATGGRLHIHVLVGSGTRLTMEWPLSGTPQTTSVGTSGTTSSGTPDTHTDTQTDTHTDTHTELKAVTHVV